MTALSDLFSDAIRAPDDTPCGATAAFAALLIIAAVHYVWGL